MILREQRRAIVGEILRKQWEKNYVENKRFIKQHFQAKGEYPYFVPLIGNKDTKKAALCVGAGPSLGKNLKHIDDSLYTIVSCDKVAGTLAEFGIKVDAVVALNAAPTEVGEWIELANNKDTKLVIPIGVHPNTYIDWKGPIEFINAVTASGLHERVLSELGMPLVTIGSNAGTFAYTIAAMSNHNPIGYMGMDFSFVRECEVLNKQDYPRKFNILKMTDINGDVRYLDLGWFDMAQAFQENARRFGEWYGIKTYNCTEGGINYSECVGEMTLNAFNEMCRRMKDAE